MKARLQKQSADSQLVLSLFHGIDLFGRGFEKEGFCVVRAGEIDLGFDVRDLHLPPGRFDGIIAGTPCQDFSLANRTHRTYDGYGKEMLQNYCRLLTEAKPDWFCLENVPSCPDIHVSGYSIQRFDLNARQCGLKQNRLRHFQFGSRDGKTLILRRDESQKDFEPCVTSTEGTKKKIRRPFTKFLELQGIEDDFSFPYFKQSEKYKIVGQGVPVPMARMIAAAIRESTSANLLSSIHRVCICGCGRIVEGKAKAANATCRKRMQIRRDSTSECSRRTVTFEM